MHEGLNRVIMAVGAHADDIELWAGGTLLKYRDCGYRIVYVMATNNMSGGIREWEDGKIVSRPRLRPEAQMTRRKSECEEAANTLGTTPIHLDHPQRHFNTGVEKQSEFVHFGSSLPEGIPSGTPTILTAYEHRPSVEKVVELILTNDPEVILTHPVATTNIEHFATSLLVTIAFWEAVQRGFQGGLLTWNEAITLFGDRVTGWDTCVRYTGLEDKKMELIALHASQKPDAKEPGFGHRLLGECWGQANQTEFAECFNWVRGPTRTDRKISGRPQPFYGPLILELLRGRT